MSAGIKANNDGSAAIQVGGVDRVTLSDVGVMSVPAGIVAGLTGNASTATQLSTASGSAPSYAARAWVNFNGTGTVAIRASGNVSSITDNGVGDYTVNFATAMPDANYSYHTSSKQETAGSGDVGYTTNGSPTSVGDGPAGMTTTRIRLRFTNTDPAPALRDMEVTCVSIFR